MILRLPSVVLVSICLLVDVFVGEFDKVFIVRTELVIGAGAGCDLFAGAGAGAGAGGGGVFDTFRNSGASITVHLPRTDFPYKSS